jgi:glutamyl-Q tRNA(Asp) synthetase
VQAALTLPVFRFAPSPNGRLHLGHAYSALLNAEFAERLGGRLLLRIEDIDVTRCRPEFVVGIEEDLNWLGFRWEKPVRLQSEHFADYVVAFSALRQKRLAYPCFCSRKALGEAVRLTEDRTGTPWRRDPDGAPHYTGTCKGLPADEAMKRIKSAEPHTWRIDMALACNLAPESLAYRRTDLSGVTVVQPVAPARWGDAVIVRREIPTSYHLSVVVDDALQGITHVVRGQDLEAATDLHVLLQWLLGLPTPLYHHHGLIRDEQGDKLAKSRVSVPLRELREQGVSSLDVRRRLGFA